MMNFSVFFDLLIGFGVSLFTAQNDTRTVATLRKLQAAKNANARIEEHMQRVADSLINGVPLDWDALDADIDAEVSAFLAR